MHCMTPIELHECNNDAEQTGENLMIFKATTCKERSRSSTSQNVSLSLSTPAYAGHTSSDTHEGNEVPMRESAR